MPYTVRLLAACVLCSCLVPAISLALTPPSDEHPPISPGLGARGPVGGAHCWIDGRESDGSDVRGTFGSLLVTAIQGKPSAENTAGCLYIMGSGGQPDPQKAIDSFTRAV